MGLRLTPESFLRSAMIRFDRKAWQQKYDQTPERKSRKREAIIRFKKRHPRYYVTSVIVPAYCYLITIAGLKYFGSSTQKHRWMQHLNRLKHGTHHNPRVQMLYNRGNKPTFKKLIIGPPLFIKRIEYKLIRRLPCLNTKEFFTKGEKIW